MRFAGRDFQGAKSFDFTLTEGIALVAGVNAAGKSSISRAIGMALTGEVPIAPKDMSKMIRYGATNAEVQIFRDDQKDYCARVTFNGSGKDVWRNPEHEPRVSVYAAGLKNLADEKHEDRVAILNKLCKTEPTEKDLIDAVLYACDSDAERKLRTDLAKEAYKQVAVKGWDNVCKSYETVGKAKKQEWAKLAGTSYLPANAHTWMPKGWSEDLRSSSEDTLKQSIASAKHNLESHIGAEAVDEATRAELAAAAEGYTKAKVQEAKDAKADSAKWNAQYLTAVSELQSLMRAPAEEQIVECLECKAKHVVVNFTTLRKPAEKRTAKEQKEIDELVAIKQAEKKDLIAASDAAEALAKELGDALVIAKKAFDRLTEINESNAPLEKFDESKVEAQRREVESLENKLRAYVLKRDCDDIHNQIVRNTALVKALDVEGIRGERTAQALRKVNEEVLKPLCEIAEWAKVEIGSDLKVRYNELDYAYGPATSEQFRARVTLQCALAILDESELLVIDAADILDRDGRAGLFAMLGHVDIPTIVTMTIFSKDEAPLIEENDLGKTYWLEDARLSEIVTAGATR